MKELSFERMENVRGGVRFNGDMNCGVAAVGFGLGVVGVLTGAGALAGLSAIVATTGALMTCFPMDY
ncbi:hypothetical protein [Echinicola rosea]|uniref:Uncharacterized protein n=1 Tax=Echinicola rosea TaxID=1807691 RepID=A0ABQ1UHL9_9BACT|nr:hypothetical protein [Echinicola rosea]GGF17619.1 hypothetical protein GCM10011339_01930 [Echinicola rosea]